MDIKLLVAKSGHDLRIGWLFDKMCQTYQQLFIVYKVYKGSEVYSAELMRVLRGSWQSSGSIPCGWLEDA